MVRKKRYRVRNIDTVLIADAPKIEPFKEIMKDNISRVLNVEKNNISIKATTSEGVGAIGRGEAMAAHAVVLLKESK